RITYADGSTQSADVGFSDWTLGAGADRPSFGNVTAADTPYRNSSSSSQRIDTYLFGTAPITLQSGKTVRSVTLPGDVNGGGLHVFSIGFGTAAG
ncbi:MAG: hypothetical protein ACRDQ1_14845, partial [Sciscionella sp.]